MEKSVQNQASEANRITQELASQQVQKAQEFFFNPILTMQRQMSRIMADMLENFSHIQQSMPEIPSLEKVMPKVDVWEDSKAFYLETKVPGMEPDEIDISVNDNAMTITCGSEKASEQTEKGQTLYQKHSACRTVMIPGNADADKAKAEVKDEALVITLPKKKSAADKRKKILVERTA
ncbi:MAG: hypothetical protein CO093_07330 [Alphaproteobacteria bacterium CG_4_9_14_3_um_filter_47_13]|nr:MAG: hypothetical protein CO093_07330 [Alphaproteobacteria bacterium CG_4_9_14_3_um_filter_47_13]